MHTTIHPLYAPLWIKAARAIRREADALCAVLQRRQRQRATRLVLGALDDPLLRDLGLDRRDVASRAAHPGDPARLLTWRSSW